MMPLLRLFSRRLYLRIWLAVVGGVAVLTLGVAWVWHSAEQYNAQNAATNRPRSVRLLDAQGQPLLDGRITQRTVNGETAHFAVTADGGEYELQITARPRRAGGGERGAAFWMLPPFGFLWMLALVGAAVVLGVFPIIRRLLKRLENLQRGVQRFGEGDLSVRVPEAGHDEVADLARQFNAAAARIETLVAAHKSLLANASHELRSPLTRIRMSLAFAGQEAGSARAHAEIQRNIVELDQLIDEILLASRLDAHESDMGSMEAVDLIGLVAEECARVDADLDIGTLEALEVSAVPRLLRRAVRNLLENARRYSDGGVQLHLARSGGMARIRVCDHGPGVPAAQREKIFDKFYRLPGTSEGHGGVGLGLALVRSIAERHGGNARCEERPDGLRGACFVLQMPLQPA